MIELLDSRRNSQEISAFFHLMNPSKTTWSSIVPAIEKAYGIPSAPLEEWIGELVSIENPSEEEVQKKPALKLLDFYRGMAAGRRMLAVTVDTRKTQEGSATMAGLAPIDERLMGNWIQQWGF